MKLVLDLDTEISAALIERACSQLRPIKLQAEVELRRGLGLPFPSPLEPSTPLDDVQSVVGRRGAE